MGMKFENASEGLFLPFKNPLRPESSVSQSTIEQETSDSSKSLFSIMFCKLRSDKHALCQLDSWQSSNVIPFKHLGPKIYIYNSVFPTIGFGSFESLEFFMRLNTGSIYILYQALCFETYFLQNIWPDNLLWGLYPPLGFHNYQCVWLQLW